MVVRDAIQNEIRRRRFVDITGFMPVGGDDCPDVSRKVFANIESHAGILNNLNSEILPNVKYRMTRRCFMISALPIDQLENEIAVAIFYHK